jgi:segregation and condensation protein B
LSSLKDLPGLKELRAAGLLESRPPPGTSLKEEEFSENNGDSDEADFFEDDD